MFIFLRQDGFSNNAESVTTGVGLQDGTKPLSQIAVRRPYRGVQIKEDTFAILSIRKADGSPIPLLSSSAVMTDKKEITDGHIGKVSDYSDFIIQGIQDERVEKQQIVETFGDSFVFFFGERPRVMNINGLLINTADFDWRSQFWYNYENHIRGTKLVQANARAYFAYDTMVIEGYPLSASATDTADQPYSIPFNMTLLVTNVYDHSVIGRT